VQLAACSLQLFSLVALMPCCLFHMKPVLIYCLLFLGYEVAHSQNLLVNGGFEDENICTEYEKNCAPEAWIATSLYFNYYFSAPLKYLVKAHEGTHYAGLAAGSLGMQGIRNFIRTRLLCGLQKGHQYKLEMYVFSLHPVLDSIGVYFSRQDFLYERRYFKLIIPQLWTINGLDTTIKKARIWQKVELLYTADGTEGFITIGNFKRIDHTGIPGPDFRDEYYFFLDDVSLTPVNAHEKLCEQADSVKKEIYNENERHSILERKVNLYRRNPPPVFPLPQTTEEKKMQRIDTLVIPDIFFATARYELTPASFYLLDSFASQLKLPEIDSMIVEGHTDSIGKLTYNETLSLNRATSVKDYLLGKVANLEEKTITRGYAYLRPVASNSTPHGRKLNRRVEIIIFRKEE
jgi:outer membrane protein OmpA-like peptidoglycan-associated protein